VVLDAVYGVKGVWCLMRCVASMQWGQAAPTGVNAPAVLVLDAVWYTGCGGSGIEEPAGPSEAGRPPPQVLCLCKGLSCANCEHQHRNNLACTCRKHQRVWGRQAPPQHPHALQPTRVRLPVHVCCSRHQRDRQQASGLPSAPPCALQPMCTSVRLPVHAC